jgi:hypothetical protein
MARQNTWIQAWSLSDMNIIKPFFSVGTHISNKITSLVTGKTGEVLTFVSVLKLKVSQR